MHVWHIAGTKILVPFSFHSKKMLSDWIFRHKAPNRKDNSIYGLIDRNIVMQTFVMFEHIYTAVGACKRQTLDGPMLDVLQNGYWLHSHEYIKRLQRWFQKELKY